MAQSKYPKPADPIEESARKKLPTKKVMTIVMDDGSVHEINIGRPSLRRMFVIAHDGRQPNDDADAYWMAWHAIGRPGYTGGEDDEALEAFIDAIQAEGISEEEVDLGGVPT